MIKMAISMRQRGLALLLGLCVALGAMMQAAPAQAFEVEEIRILPAGSNVVTGTTSVEFGVKFSIWVFSVDPSDFRVGNDPLNANATLSPSIATVTSVRAGSGYTPDYDDLWYVTVSGANLASYTGQLSLALAADHVITEGFSFNSENLIPAVREWWDVRSAPPPPPLPAPYLYSGFDSGISNSDGITNSTTLQLRGNRTADMTAVELFYEQGGATTSLGQSSLGEGFWVNTMRSRQFSDGTLNFFAVATYASGQKRETERLAITLDRKVEDAVFTFTERGSDVSSTDGITNQRVFDYTLQAEANSQVRLSNFPTTQVLSWSHQPGPFSFSGSFSLADGPEGEYKINVQTTDAAGNTRTQEVARITLDTVAPTISSVRLAEESDSGYSNSDGVTNEPFPKFSAVFAGAAAQARLTLDGTVLTPWTAVAPDGRWTSEKPIDILKGRVRIEARDLAANIATTDYSYKYEQEREIPTSVYAHHSPDRTAEFVTADTISLSLSSTIRELFRVRLNRDGAPFSPLITRPGIVDLGPLVDGEQLTGASFVAEDHAGNPIIVLLTPATITVDMTAPDLPVITLLDDDGVSPTDLIFSVANPRVRITGEAGALVRVSGGGDVLYFTMPASGIYEARLSGLTAGTHTLAVEIRDPAGNITTGTFGPITFDTSPPAGATTRIAAASDSGFSNSDGITNVARPTLEARATDAAQGRLTAPYVTGWTDLVGGVWTHAAADDLNGTYTVELRDVAGNTASTDASFTYLPDDLRVSDLRFDGAWKTGTSDTQTNRTSLTIDYSLSDPNDRPLFVDEGTLTGAAAVTPDAASFAFGASPITLNPLGDGTTVDLTALRVVDEAGNVLPLTITGPDRLTVGLTAPVPPTLELVNDVSVAPGFVYINTSVPRLRVTALPDPGFWDWDTAVASGVVELTAVGQEFDLPALPDDGYYVLFNATDAAGNDSDDYFFGPFEVDTVPPSLTRALLEQGSDSGFDNTDQITNLARPWIYLSLGCCTHQARLRKGADVGAWQDVDNNLSAFLSPDFDLNGAYSVDLRDAAGNIASSDHTYTYLPPLADTVENRLTVSHAGTGGDDAWSNLTQVPLTVTNPTGRAFRQVGAGAPQTGFMADAVVTLALDARPEGAQLRPADLLAFEDEAGNPLAFAATPEMITIDTTAPSIASARISAQSDTGFDSSDQITNVRAPRIEAVINDGFEARIVKDANASDWTLVPPDGRWSAEPGFDLDGSYRIEARDRAGNLAVADHTYTWLPPATSGDLEISYERPGFEAFEPYYIIAPQVDLRVVSTLGRDYRLRMETETTFTDFLATPEAIVTFAGLVDGQTLNKDFLRAEDRAGNDLGYSLYPTRLEVDLTLPGIPTVMLGDDDGDGIVNTPDPRVTITGPEPGVRLRIAGGGADISVVIPASGSIDAALTGLTEGTHDLTLTAADPAGNVNSTLFGPVTLDLTPPTIASIRLAPASDSGFSDSDGATNVPRPMIVAQFGGDAAQARLSLLGTPVTDWTAVVPDATWQSDVPDSDLRGVVTVELRDLAGNVVMQDHHYDYFDPNSDDMTLSVTHKAGPDVADPAFVVRDTVTLDMIRSNAVLFRARLDRLGAPFGDLTAGGDVIFTGLVDGDRLTAADIIAEDIAGNPLTVQLTPATITVDRTPPILPAIALETDDGLSDSDMIIGQADPFLVLQPVGEHLRVTLGTGTGHILTEANSATRVQLTGLGEGVHRLEIVALDAAGNETAGTFGPVTIDLTAPSVESLRIAAGSDSGFDDSDGITNDPAPVIEARFGGDAAEARLSAPYDSGWSAVAADGSWSVTPLQDLAGRFTVELRDLAGNVAVQDHAYTYLPALAVDVANLRLDPDSDSGAKGDGITNAASGMGLLWDVTGARSTPVTLEILNGSTRLHSAGPDPLGDGIVLVKPADGKYALSLRLTDAAGNSAVVAGPLDLSVDSVAPELPVLTLAAGVDGGIFDDDRHFATTTPGFDIAVGPGDDVTLTWESDIAPGARPAIALAAGTLTQHVFDARIPGTHKVTVRVSDVAGNTATGTLAPFTIDTETPDISGAPRIAAADDSGLSDSDAITNVSAPVIEIPLTAAEARYNDGTRTGAWAAADADGIWRQPVDLGAGTHDLRLELRSKAGLSGFSGIATAQIVTAPPPAPERPDLAAASDTGAAADDNITSHTAGLILSMSGGRADIDRRLDLRSADGAVVASASPLGTDPGIVTLDLAEGVHVLRAQAVDLAGNLSPLSEPLEIVVDTTAPDAPDAGLRAADDTGLSDSDAITSRADPVLEIRHETGGTVAVIPDNGATLTALTPQGAELTLAALTLPADGTYRIALTVTDAAGNSSSPSLLTLERDSTPPPLPVLTLADAPAPDLSATARPAFDLYAPEAVTWVLAHGATVLAEQAMPGSGQLRIPPALDLPEGPVTVTVTVRDLAGNTSEATLSFTVDSLSPETPTLTLDAQDDTGESDSDGITSLSSGLTLRVAPAPGATDRLLLSDPAGVLARGAPGADSVDIDLAEGVHTLTAQVEDAAGNVSGPSAPLTLVIDTTAPDAPVAAWTAASDTGLSDTDAITAQTRPVAEVGFEAGATLAVTLAGDMPGIIAQGAGRADVIFALPDDGTHVARFSVSDAAGNRSAPTELTVVLDRVAPTDVALALVDPPSPGISATLRPMLDIQPGDGARVRLSYGGADDPWIAIPAPGPIRVTLPRDLVPGAQTITLLAEDRAGNATSVRLDVRVDTSIPAAPDLVLASADDTGISDSDGITQKTEGLTLIDRAPAVADEYLRLLSDRDGPLGDTAPGQFTRDVSLSEGIHRITGQRITAAGNVSGLSAPLVLVVDVTPPASPVGHLDPADDAGGGLTASGMPGLIVTHEPEARIEPVLPAGLVLAERRAVAPDQTYLALGGGSDGPVSVGIVASDAAGNPSPAGMVEFTLDRSAPVLSFEVPNEVQTGPFSARLHASEPVLGLEAAKIVVSGGSLSDFAAQDQSWSFTVTPSAASVTLFVAEGAVRDAAGNPNGALSATVAVDPDAPVATLELPAGPYSGPVTARIRLTKPVRGLDQSDLILSHATVDDFRAVADGFVFTLVPSFSGDIRIDIPSGAFADLNGNSNAQTLLSLGGAAAVPAAQVKIPVLLTRGLVLDAPEVSGRNVTLVARMNLTAGETPSALLTQNGAPITTAPEIGADRLIWRLDGLQPGLHDFALSLPETDRHLVAMGQFDRVAIALLTYAPGTPELPDTAFAGETITLRLPIGPAAAEGTLARITAGAAQIEVPVTQGAVETLLTMPDTGDLAILISLPGSDLFAPLADHPVATVARRSAIPVGMTLAAASDGLMAGDRLAWTLDFDSAPQSGQATVTATIAGPNGPVTQTLSVDLDGTSRLTGDIAIPVRGMVTLAARVPATPRTEAGEVTLSPFAAQGRTPGLDMTWPEGPVVLGRPLVIIAQSGDADVVAALSLRSGDGTDFGAPAVTGSVARWQVTPETAGTLHLVLDFPGDELHIPVRLGRTVEITQPYAIDLSVTGRPVIGETMTLVAAVSPGTPVGTTMVFFANGQEIGTVTDQDAGRFVLEHALDTAGDVVFSARLLMAADTAPVATRTLTLAIARREVALVVSVPDGPHDAGAVLPVTARINPDSAQGIVVFVLNGAEAARVDLAGGSAATGLRIPVGESRLEARYEGDAMHAAAVSGPLVLRTITAQKVLDDHQERILQTLTASGRTAAKARGGQMDRMMGGVRGRLGDRRSGRDVPTRGYRWSGIDPTGTIDLSDTTGRIAGQFQGDGIWGDFTRYLSGDFAVVREDGITSGQINITLLLERSLGNNTLGGFVLGAEIGRSSVTSPLDGTVDRLGLSLGAYGAHFLAGDMILDGYMIYTRSFGQSDLASGTARFNGDFAEDGIAARIALSGRYEIGEMIVEPVLSLSHLAGRVDPGRFNVIAGPLVGSGVLPDTDWALTELQLAPRMTWNLGVGRSLWLEPGASLQWERDTGTRDNDSAVSLELGGEWLLDNGARLDIGLGHQFGGLRAGSEFTLNYEVSF